MNIMLTYTTIGIEKSIKDLKQIVRRDTAFAKNNVQECLKRLEGSSDILKKYQYLVYSYSSSAECYLLADGDVENFKGYCFLAAKAADILYRLYDEGYRTHNAFIRQLENRNHIRYTQYAILANHKQLALSLAQPDTPVGCMLSGDYEKAKALIPDQIQAAKYTSYIDEILWTIIYGDEKKMNRLFEKRIRMLRRQARPAMPTILDSYGLALIKLAQARNMNCNLHVRELPYDLLDHIPVDDEAWKLLADV